MHRWLVSLVVMAGLQAQSAWLTVPGPGAGQQFGRVLAVLGDVDGDGHAEFAVGLPQAGGLTWAGEVRVVSGRDGQLLRVIAGAGAGDRFGATLASLGDLDGDGVDELAVGAPYADVGAQDTGAVSVWSLRSGTLLRTVSSGVAFESFGTDVGAAGDLDGDLVPDLAVGAQFADHAGREAGAVYAISGRTFAQLRRYDGTRPDALAGFAVAGVGDLDGDGRADLAYSEYEVALGGRGVVYVRSGATGAVLYTWQGDQFGDLFGHDLASAGDVDADGRPDVLVGIYGQGVTAPVAGGMRVLSGRTGATLADFGGLGAFHRFGASVAGVGDTDGDGHAEWLVGSQFLDYAILFDGRTRQPRVTLRGSGFFGAAVAAGRDLTGDGWPDLAIGAWRDVGSGVDAGRVDVLSARSLSLTRDVAVIDAAVGGRQSLALQAPSSFAGRAYLVVGSASGTRPGTPIFGATIPLVFDAYTDATITAPNSGPWLGTLGVLDGSGRATAAFDLVRPEPALAGLRLDHAAVLLPVAGTIDFVSNPVPLTLR